MLTRLFDGPIDPVAVLLALISTLAAAWFIARYVQRLTADGLRALVRDTVATSSPLIRGPVRLIAAAAFFLVAAVLIMPAFEVAGLRPRTGVHLRTLAAWTFGAGLRVLLIAVLAYVLVRLTSLLVRRFEHEMTIGTDLDALERAKRARTLGGVIRRGVTVLVSVVAALMVLREFEVDIAPALTGAGILGLAVGFGAQALVRDIISGFFLILENQVRVGDVAVINGTGGLVEAINLRTIVLRDIEGTVHVFPNGAISTLANRTKDFSYYVIDLSVSYYDDSDRLSAVLRQIGEEMQRDRKFGSFILEPIEILGVDGFEDWSMQVKVRIKTVPLKQWEVGRELRRRIVKAFEENGFTIPFPVPATAVRPESRQGQ